MSRFEVMNHIHVPEHRLLSPKEAEDVLAKYSISIEELPKIKRSDACIRSLELRVGEIPRGSIVKVICDIHQGQLRGCEGLWANRQESFVAEFQHPHHQPMQPHTFQTLL